MSEAVKPQAVQGITVMETPIKFDIKDGSIYLVLEDCELKIPQFALELESVVALKKFVDHTYRTALNKGFQIAINKNENGSKTE